MGFKKGDRVYVSFDIEKTVVKDGNNYAVSDGVFQGNGTLDAVDDGYIRGRLDNGRTFSCNESDAVLIQPNSEAPKVGDRIAVPWGSLVNHPNCDGAWLGGISARMDQGDKKYFKTVIRKIETRWLFGLLKRKQPLYCVQYGLIALKFKPVMRGKHEA